MMYYWAAFFLLISLAVFDLRKAIAHYSNDKNKLRLILHIFLLVLLVVLLMQLVGKVFVIFDLKFQGTKGLQ